MAAADLNDPLLRLQVYDTGGDPGAGGARRPARRSAAGRRADPRPALRREHAGGRRSGLAATASTSSRSRPTAASPAARSSSPASCPRWRRAGSPASRGRSGYDPLRRPLPRDRLRPAGAARRRGGAPARPSSSRTSYPRTNEGIPPAADAFAAQVQQTGARGLLLADMRPGPAIRRGAADRAGLPARRTRSSSASASGTTRSTLETPELVGGWFASTDPDALRAFVERYRGRYGTVPPQLAFLGYDAVQIAEQLLAEARRTGRRTVQPRRRSRGRRASAAPSARSASCRTAAASAAWRSSRSATTPSR